MAEGKLKIDVACFNLQTPKSVVSVSDVKIMLVTGRMHAVSHVARDKFLHSGRPREDFCYGRVLVGFFLGEYVCMGVLHLCEEGVPTVILADLWFSLWSPESSTSA